jgi:hypothetical protein
MLLDPSLQSYRQNKSANVSVNNTAPSSPSRKSADTNNNSPAKQHQSPKTKTTVGTSPVIAPAITSEEIKPPHTGNSEEAEVQNVATPPGSPKLPEGSDVKKSPVKKFAEYFEKKAKLTEVGNTVRASNSFKMNKPLLETVKELGSGQMPLPLMMSPTVEKDVIIEVSTPTPQTNNPESIIIEAYTPEPNEEALIQGGNLKRSNSVKDRIKVPIFSPLRKKTKC